MLQVCGVSIVTSGVVVGQMGGSWEFSFGVTWDFSL